MQNESLTIYQDINDRGGLARVHYGLGAAALRQREIDNGYKYLHHALHLARELDHVRLQSLIRNVHEGDTMS